MGVITILLAAGIGVFLFWFFEGIVKELAKADDNESEYVILRRSDKASCRNQRLAAPLSQCASYQVHRSAAPPSGRCIAVRRDLPVQNADIRERISTRRAS